MREPRKIFEPLRGALGCEKLELQLDKTGVVVTLNDKIFALLALKLMSLRTLEMRLQPRNRCYQGLRSTFLSTM